MLPCCLIERACKGHRSPVVTIARLPPVVVLRLQRNFVRGVSLGKGSKGGFGPIRPAGHLHGAVQLDGGGELGTGLFPSAGPSRQHAETEVTMGLEWAHAEFYSKRHGLLVNILSLVDLVRQSPRPRSRTGIAR
jgi:hypothetical protein